MAPDKRLHPEVLSLKNVVRNLIFGKKKPEG